MKLLILGGTKFLGRHAVDAALARGHEVTIFTRGQTNPALFPEIERLHGDRDGGLGVLTGRRWDAVIDTSAYVPRLARASAEALRDAVERYVFISTISVYPEFSKVGITEDDPVGTMEDETIEEVGGRYYGPLKALCERAVREVLPDKTIIIRPGLIVGPHDPTNRFTYWPTRVTRGGDVLVPRSLDWPTQIIDARDLGAWAVTMAESGAPGVYNATGPDYPLTFGEVFNTCRDVAQSDARPIIVSEEFLSAAKVGPWMELPLWIPDTPENAGFSAVDCRRALAAGLTFRPLDETVRDTLAWDRSLPAEAKRVAGLAPEREAELLRTWQAQQAGALD
ncbi:MAG TPA: NAD-dependent epimerase/dehydratase family protein [Thermomicrobiales bacterium]